MVDPSIFEPVPPWAMPDRAACTIYHSLDFDDGDSVDGAWDIRGQFGSYVGDDRLRGKTMLDFGNRDDDRRVFANGGFDMRNVSATARNGNVVQTRPTLVAECRRG